MSCFPGRMKEYKEVSIDRFDGENLSSTVYFLSHNHSDHTVGLASNDMLYRLESNSHIKFYCSEVTKELLAAEPKYEKLVKFITGLPTEDPQCEDMCHTTIPVPDHKNGKEKYKMNVTLLPAAHCPGSVMFLFEGHEGTSLYTGDFRLSREDLQLMPSLKCGTKAPVIDSLYVDTTFCVPQAFFIPSRDESADAVTSLIDEWISQSKNHMIILHCRANLGYEHVFRVLALYFQTKIHVNQHQFDKYQRISDLAPYFTTDATETQIHACKWNPNRIEGARLPCGYVPSGKRCLEIRKLSLSTMYFTQRVTNASYVAKTKHCYRVCYSFHSSYSEIRDMLLYLEPKRVFPNVKPIDCTMEKVQERLNEFLKLAKKSKPVTPVEQKVVPLGRLRRKRKKLFDSPSQNSDEDLMFDDDVPKAKVTKNEGMFSFKYDEPSEGENDENRDELTDSQKSRDKMQTSESDYTPVKTSNKRLDSLTSSGQQSSGSKENSQNVKDTSPTENHLDGSDNAHRVNRDNVIEEDMTQQDQELMQGFKPALSGSMGSFLAYASDMDNWSEVDENEMPGLPARIHDYQHDSLGLILSQGSQRTKNESTNSQGNNSIDLFSDSTETGSQPAGVELKASGPISSVKGNSDSKGGSDSQLVKEKSGIANNPLSDNVTVDRGCDSKHSKISDNVQNTCESKQLNSASDIDDCDKTVNNSKTNKLERDQRSKSDNLPHLNKLLCGAHGDPSSNDCSSPKPGTSKLSGSQTNDKDKDSIKGKKCGQEPSSSDLSIEEKQTNDKDKDSIKGKKCEQEPSSSDLSIEEKDDDVIYVGETLEDPSKESDGYQCDAEDSDATVDESPQRAGKSPCSQKSTPQRKHRYKRSQLDSFHRANRRDEDDDDSSSTTSTESSDVVIDLTADDSQAEINFAGGSSDSYFYDSDQTIDYSRQNQQKGASSSKRKNCNTAEDDVIVLDDESPEKVSARVETVEHIVSMGSDYESVSKTDSSRNTSISDSKEKTGVSVKKVEDVSKTSDSKLKSTSHKIRKSSDQKNDKISTSDISAGSGGLKRKSNTTPVKTSENKKGKKSNGHASHTNAISIIDESPEKLGDKITNANTSNRNNISETCRSASQKSSDVRGKPGEREPSRQDLDCMHIDLVLAEGVTHN